MPTGVDCVAIHAASHVLCTCHSCRLTLWGYDSDIGRHNLRPVSRSQIKQAKKGEPVPHAIFRSPLLPRTVYKLYSLLTRALVTGIRCYVSQVCQQIDQTENSRDLWGSYPRHHTNPNFQVPTRQHLLVPWSWQHSRRVGCS